MGAVGGGGGKDLAGGCGAEGHVWRQAVGRGSDATDYNPQAAV